ncbi:DsbA family protein [Fictibacillus aquaticus]|uniref:Thiol-disulfide oxidoreductase n=1 Tax=Fictibacillus aquaticus TaxID=2021314 RepID=A0A235F835_9BACL|nr:thioredoxin domain-containing protein [Fictibacillus aquaticus]OYD57428.1 thiol-disulfide oxidoreductase [Fictibacillus aquaticus]
MANKKKYTKKPAQKKSSNGWIFLAVGIVAALAAILIFSGAFEGKKDTAENDIDYSGQPFLGDENAPVEMIEFGDYKCPACKNFNEQLFPVIEKELIDTGKVKFYFMNYAFINVDSERSAKFAEAVYKELGSETFWKFHHKLYEEQPADHGAEKQDIFTEDKLTSILAGVSSESDAEKVKAAYTKDAADKAFETDKDLVSELGVKSTPTLFVDGEEFTGKSLDDLKKMVEDAAKEKK